MSVERARENIQFAYDFLYGTRPKERDMSPVQEILSEALRELQPEPRIIDWQRVVDNQLPVIVWDKSPGKPRTLTFLDAYSPKESFPFKVMGAWGRASLETGQWVFNSSGKNPWPEGVVFKAWQRSGAIQEFCSCDVPADWWRLDEGEDNIIASRAVGLEEGWSYGGGG